MTLIPIVDNQDNILEYKEKATISADDIYRVSVLWVRNTAKTHILLAQRALNKSHDPGKWEPAVAGTLEDKETYLENILHEIQEEIGLTIAEIEFTVGPKLFLSQEWKFFCQFYLLERDIELNHLTLQTSEVKDVRWWNREDIAKQLKENRNFFTKNFHTLWNILEPDLKI